MPNIKLEAEGIDASVFMINAVQANILETAPVMAEIGAMIIADNAANWGTRWAPLSDATLANKAATGVEEPLVAASRPAYPKSPAREEMDLKNSLTVLGAPHQIMEVANGKLRVGTSLWYAGWNQKGTREKGTSNSALKRSYKALELTGGSPPRRMTRASVGLRRAIQARLEAHYVEVDE
jgi:hypothetical protein